MSTAIFWPMIAQVLLIFLVYVVVSRRRFGAVRSGAAKAGDFYVPFTEPQPSATAVRNLINQFELPVLFFAACLSLQMAAGVSILTLVLAWLFVVSRYVHSYVHLTSNRLRHRRPLFIVGFAAVFALWGLLALHLLGLGL
ncbi:MAPEG family protein [Pseudohoeflea coraliihabitans]|uniref:MAPEG family protein n=1 Tax=Pseudohoeflea coraliihabitans TaxID=2860393 RepID=A0ABS6WMF8_9HYPH|nr:MAPEG family protein [Pseudohoeflea sp. DP4N28-3]MBW3097133.1 MAPEG family protein [Pseudohoeflea sp. DP4N28-3]